jgi:hypothetical protein
MPPRPEADGQPSQRGTHTPVASCAKYEPAEFRPHPAQQRRTAKMRCTMGDESNSIRRMAPDGWEVLESLPEIEFRRTGVEGWEALRRQAIGMA